MGVRSEDPGGGALASAAVFSIASITGRARDNPRPSYGVETRRSKIRIGPERKLEPVWVGKGEGGERRRLADFKGLPRVRRGERSLICCHLSFPLPALEIRSLSLAPRGPQGAARASTCSPSARPTPGDGDRALGCTRARTGSVQGRGSHQSLVY